MLSAILLIPSLIPILGIIFLGWNPSVIAFSILPGGPLAIWSFAHFHGYRRFDADRDVLDSVIDMLAMYPDDWTWKDIKGKQSKSVIGIAYSLHDKVRIAIDTRDGYNEVYVHISDPETGAENEYQLRHGFRKAVKAKIANVRRYHEMKTVVNVTLFADEHRSASDKARAALDSYRETKFPKAISTTVNEEVPA